MSRAVAAVVAAATIISSLTVVAGGRVLIVHSYHPEYAWVREVQRGFDAGFAGTDITVESFYMDTKRIADLDWKIQSGQAAKAKASGFRPNVIITVDDNAQEFFAQQFRDKRSPKIVFCGVNGDPADFGFPSDNVTGVVERPHFAETIELALRIKPDIKTIAVLSDDSPTGRASVEYIKQQKSPVTVVECRMPSLFEEWQQSVRDLEKLADAIAIPVYHTVKRTADGMSMRPSEVMKWTRENCAKPLIGFWSFAVEDGCLCAVAVSGEKQGYAAAELAKLILGGTKVASLPVRSTKVGVSMLNCGAAEALGLEIPFDVLMDVRRLVE